MVTKRKTTSRSRRRVIVPKAEMLNNVLICIDCSGSMQGLSKNVEKCFNEIIKELAKQEKVTGQRTVLSVYTFDDRIDRVHFGEPVYNFRHFSGNSTALMDCVAQAINDGNNLLTSNLSYLDKNAYYDVSNMVILITDGAENASKIHPSDFKKLIKEQNATDKWTFVAHVPDRDGCRYLMNLGFVEGNIYIWEQTVKGVREVEVKTSGGIQSYYTSRSFGVSHMNDAGNTFFQPDLSSVTPTQLKRNLTDLSNDYNVYVTTKEYEIKQFVEFKTGRNYKKGTAFYQLMKPEKVQSNKDVLVMDKTSKHIYGGREARDLLKLPDYECKVEPGNHANYEIFIQSTSTNRKLPRGTKVAVRNW